MIDQAPGRGFACGFHLRHFVAFATWSHLHNFQLFSFFLFFFNQLSKLEKQQQRKEKTRAKGPSESSKERNTPRKEDRSASSGAEGDVSSEREP